MQNRTYGCPPKLEGKELDQMPWMAKGLQLHGHGAGPEAGLNKPVPLCVPQWSHTGEHGLTCAGPRPVLLVCHPSLPCCHQAEPLPCGICALFPCIHMTGKICQCCPWLQFKSILCHCTFYGTSFTGEFGQNAVVVQLVNTNCWFWHVCSKWSGCYLMYLLN